MVSTLSSAIAIVLALSISVERLVEILKGMLSTIWLFTPQSNVVSELRRCACIHILSAALGVLVAWITHLDLIHVVDPSLKYPLTGAFLAGLLSSAGSAFWNHVLDILKAFKVRQEVAAERALM